MPRAPKPCDTRGCEHDKPCPQHARKAWAGHRSTGRRNDWGNQTRNQRIMREHEGVCHICGQPGSDVIDHVIPFAEGGLDVDDNKRPAHQQPCHAAKSAAEAARGRARARAARG